MAKAKLTSHQEQRYLIIGPSWVGDMIMAQVLFKVLKNCSPNAVIDVMAPAHSGAVVAYMPEVRQLIPIQLNHGELNLRYRYQIGRSLRGHYDKAIVLPNSFKSALIPFWANIKQRIGWLGELRWGLLNDVRYLNKSQLPLMIQRFAALAKDSSDALTLSALPKPELILTPDVLAQTLNDLMLEKPKKPVLALCPGAEYGPAKRWPLAYFAELASEKHKDGWDIWIFGSPKEIEDAAKIQTLSGNVCTLLAGKTSLTQVTALLSLADVVVTNDSGLMHIAAALSRPIIAIYGSSSPDFTPPLSEHVKILSTGIVCSPCFKRVCPLGHYRCLTEIKAEQVANAINAVNI